MISLCSLLLCFFFLFKETAAEGKDGGGENWSMLFFSIHGQEMLSKVSADAPARIHSVFQKRDILGEEHAC